MELLVRSATGDDTTQLDELRRLLLADLAGRRGGPALVASFARGASLADRLSRAGSGDACLFAATIDGVVVGMAGATCPSRLEAAPGARTAALDLLYVAPPARRVGVATALFAAIARWGADHGCTDLDAPALPGDRALKSFFESLGLRARLLVLNGPLRSPED